MTEYVATTPGLFPLPDWAKEELASLKGHQKTDLIDGSEPAEVGAVYEEVRSELVGLQREAGLDLYVEGQARWDDMLAHPLAVSNAVETRGIVRYFDNNNFYREPVVVEDLSPTGDLAEELTEASDQAGELQAVLPGPYTLAELATDAHYGDQATFQNAIASFLADELAACDSHDLTVLLEPSLVTDPPNKESDSRVRGAIDTVAAATETDVLVQTYWGALEDRVYAHLMDTDITGIGYDFVTAPEACLTLIQEYGSKPTAAFGLVDGQNTRMEDPATIRDRVDWVEDGTPTTSFETVYLMPNTETFYLPYGKFEEKLERLAAAAAGPEVTTP